MGAETDDSVRVSMRLSPTKYICTHNNGEDALSPL